MIKLLDLLNELTLKESFKGINTFYYIQLNEKTGI